MMWQNEFRSSSHDTKSSFPQFSLSPCFLCFCIEWPRVPTTVFCQIILSVSCDLREKKRKKERKNLRRDGIKERLFPLYFILYIYIKILSFFQLNLVRKRRFWSGGLDARQQRQKFVRHRRLLLAFWSSLLFPIIRAKREVRSALTMMMMMMMLYHI